MSDTQAAEKPIQIAVTSEDDTTQLFVLTDQGNIYHRVDVGGQRVSWAAIHGPWIGGDKPPVRVELDEESTA